MTDHPMAYGWSRDDLLYWCECSCEEYERHWFLTWEDCLEWVARENLSH